ncbi:glycosyltransferase [Microbispora sp. NEAU-D428]|uniref:glycosyltransferase n=1 Tax=Microbispora sitophila TaxID=2771537 RepID=UPI00186697A9|nr:glycosyltransferase [Microbispora sitophila]MBE3012338.1 glycosyltransferase [Microbispora sitophila]
MKPIASVVIPAFNEESTLGRCLEPLLAGAEPGELDVVVVPNGCTDGTARVARRLGARVVESARPGKANALCLGDAACSVFPRIYLDADVLLDTGSARALVAALEDSGALAAAPVPMWDLSGTSRTARRVHHVHEQLLKPRRALAGVGVYALSRAGHARVFPLPDVVADDELVHRSFGPHERVIVHEARSVVRPARTVRAHLRRRVRVRLGNRQLAKLGLPAPEGRLGPRALATLVASRSVSPLDAACYLAVLLADRALTRRESARATSITWATDTTSR